MALLDDVKKLAAEEGVELTEEMLAEIAGGAYSKEDWDSMTPEERKAAQTRSILAKIRNLPCELD